MKIAALTVFCCLALGCGNNQAPSEHRFTVTFPSKHQSQTITPAHVRWRDSLVKNLRHPGKTHVFIITDISLVEEGMTVQGQVYQHAETPTLFLISPSSGSQKVIIDQEAREIGTMGVAGIALHPHPDGKMVVCLEPTPGTGILGVLLSDTYKTGAKPPVFTGNRVSWTWGRQ